MACPNSFKFESLIALPIKDEPWFKTILVIKLFLLSSTNWLDIGDLSLSKIFEKKIEYYNDALDQLDEIFSSGLGDKTSHQMLFLVSKAMLVASPDAADKFAQLYLSVQNSENVSQCFRDFIIAARTDLDLVDRISDGTADSFDPILARLENSIKTESRNLRYWSDEEKISIIKEYDQIKSNKGAWLKENHGLYYSQIATWKKQLLVQNSDN